MQKPVKVLALLLSMALMLSVPCYAAEIEDGQIVIYHTNDVHGAVAWSEESSIGLDRVAAMKAGTPDSILVDAGDATQGLPFASLTQGEDVIDVMNAAGYDLMAAGNHEFDFGTEQLLVNAQKAQFPILAANVHLDGKPLLQQGDNNGRHVIIERGGKKIGFFGLVTAKTATSTNPERVAALEFLDEIETAKAEINALTELGADAIIAVAHVGEYTNVPCDSARLAEAMTGEYGGKLDAIIDGHSHTEENKVVNHVLIMQTGTGLSNLGKITLSFGDDNILDEIAGELFTYPEVMEATEPDPAVEEKIETVTAGLMERLSDPVAENATTLWGGTVDGIAEARVVETNLGSFAADAYRDAGERFIANAAGMEEYRGMPVIGVENGGGIRASLPSGTVTKGDLVSVFPFSNTLMLKKITPALLYETLEASVFSLSGQDAETGILSVSGSPSGGFLQVSGIRFTYDPAAPSGEKVREVSLEDGVPLDRTDNETGLILVSNNFIMAGGSGHAQLAELPLVGEIGGELETLEAYLIGQTDGGTLAVQGVHGRITPAGGYEPRDYTASILIEREDGSLAADTAVTYQLDGGEAAEGRTDSEGLLKITVSDGPHAIRLAEGGKEAYLNNYTGAGLVETEYRGFPVLQLPEQAAEAAPAESSSEAEHPPTPTPAAPETVPAQTEPVPAEQNGPAVWPWILAVAAVILAAVIVLYLKKKKK